MNRNGSSLRFQLKYGLSKLRMRVRGALVGAQPEQQPDIPETAGHDDGMMADGEAPAAPEPDQILLLVMDNRPWQQLPEQPAECSRESADVVSECQELALGRSSGAKQSPISREPQPKDGSEVSPYLMKGKRGAWGWLIIK